MFLYAAMLALGLVLGLQSSQAAVSIRADWETGNNSQFSNLECPNPSTQFAVVTSPVRQGSYAARFSETGADVWSNGTVRCMDAIYNSDETTGNDYYFGFSLYIPSTISDNVIWELHGPEPLYSISPNCSLAPFAIHSRDGGLDLRIATGNCDGGSWAHWEPNLVIPGLATQPVGKWVNFVLHIKFEENNSGLFELWAGVQGQSWPSQPLISRSGIPTMPYSNAANVHNVQLYTEMGLYPGYSGYNGNDTIYLDDYVRGSSFADVAAPDGTSSTTTQATTTQQTTTQQTTTQATTTQATTTQATTTQATTTQATTTQATTTQATTTQQTTPLPQRSSRPATRRPRQVAGGNGRAPAAPATTQQTTTQQTTTQATTTPAPTTTDWKTTHSSSRWSTTRAATDSSGSAATDSSATDSSGSAATDSSGSAATDSSGSAATTSSVPQHSRATGNGDGNKGWNGSRSRHTH